MVTPPKTSVSRGALVGDLGTFFISASSNQARAASRFAERAAVTANESHRS